MAPQRKVWFQGDPEHPQNRLFADALSPELWQQGSVADWDAAWLTDMPAPEVFAKSRAHSCINHIPGNNHLTVKSALHQTLDAAQKRWDLSDVFWPETYTLPTERDRLQQAARQTPGRAWILKPANGARGEDIQLLDTLDGLPTQGDWVVQRYLDAPHLYEGRKYVLRLYVLISSIDPLRVWRFSEGSVKLASMPYAPDERKNPYVFLTNPDVNERNTEVGVEFLSLMHYCDWLTAQGYDAARLLARIDDLIVRTVMAGCEAMRARSKAIGPISAQTYELMGLDCLIDAQLKPWLLECNLSPSLDTCALPAQGGVTEAVMKKALIDDLVGVLGMNGPTQYGGYRCLYPAADAQIKFHQLVAPSLADQRAAEQAVAQPVAPSYQPWQVEEVYENEQLFLISQAQGQMLSPNETAAWIWLQMCAGQGPEQMANELAATGDLPQVRQDIWRTLQEWSRQGLIRQSMTI